MSSTSATPEAKNLTDRTRVEHVLDQLMRTLPPVRDWRTALLYNFTVTSGNCQSNDFFRWC